MGRTTPRNHAALHVEAILRWVEREFTTPISHIIHGRDEERGGYTIIVRTSDDPRIKVDQLLMVTLLDDFLSGNSSAHIGLLLDGWRLGNTMRSAGPTQRVIVTSQGLHVEAR
jgi:hypothetical protein